MKARALPENYNAVTILEHNLEERFAKIALYSDARKLSFGAVSGEANRIGNGLRQLGVDHGDCVGLLMPDSAEWTTAFFGTIKIGAVAVCLNTELLPEDFEHVLHDSRLKILIIHESLLALIDPIRERQPALEKVVVIGQPRHDRDIAFWAWIRGQSAELEAMPTHRDDPCSLHYSSGTTGQLKGMFHAHKDYALIAQNTGVELLGLTEQDRTFAVSKLFFVYGLGGNLVMPWYVGASIILYPGSTRLAQKVLETIDRFNPTVLYSVPTAYIGKLSISNMASRYDLGSLRLCISAAEVLPIEVWKNWKEQTGLEILDTIGCSETLHTFMANRPDDLRPGSSGKPSPGYEVKLLDDAGNHTPQGEIGNLLVKGETIVLSYLHQHELSKRVFQGPWLLTGDKYYQDTDGFYWHAGRADDMFKVGGLWVSPVEVEGVLSRHPAVLECALVESRGDNDIVKPVAFVHLQSGYQPSAKLIKELLQHCGKQLATYTCPHRFEFMIELPKTATGKIQRFKLRDQDARHGDFNGDTNASKQ